MKKTLLRHRRLYFLEFKCKIPDNKLLADKMINVFPTLFVILFGWFLSGVIHELGHAITGKMAGLNIEYIQLIPPGLSFSGKTSKSWLAAMSIAGPLLPVLVGVTGVLAIILLKKKYTFIIYTIWIFIPMMMHSLMLLCVPIGRTFGIKAPNNDVTKFIELVEWPSLAVSLIGLLLAGFCVIILKWVF